MKNSRNFILTVLLLIPSTILLAQNMQWEWVISAEGNDMYKMCLTLDSPLINSFVRSGLSVLLLLKERGQGSEFIHDNCLISSIQLN